MATLLWACPSCGADAMALSASTRVDTAVPRQTDTQTDGHRTARRHEHGAGKASTQVGRALCCDDQGASERAKRGTVRLYRAVVSNSVGGVADVQRRLPATERKRDVVGRVVGGMVWDGMGWHDMAIALPVLKQCNGCRSMDRYSIPRHLQLHHLGGIPPLQSRAVTSICLLIAARHIPSLRRRVSAPAHLQSPQAAPTHIARARSGPSQVPASARAVSRV